MQVRVFCALWKSAATHSTPEYVTLDGLSKALDAKGLAINLNTVHTHLLTGDCFLIQINPNPPSQNHLRAKGPRGGRKRGAGCGGLSAGSNKNTNKYFEIQEN